MCCRRFAWATFFFALSLLGPGTAPAAAASDFVVTTTLDAVDAIPGDGICATATGVCTLRAAIQEANAASGPRTIGLPAGTYTLTIQGRDETSGATGDLNIGSGKTVTIDGAGAASTIVDANGIDRAFHAVGGTLALSDVTVRGGNTVEGGFSSGGCISSSGSSLILTRSVVRGCNAGHSDGAGIYFRGSSSSPFAVTLADTTIAENTTTGYGGGLSVSALATVTIVRTTISGNSASYGAGLDLGLSSGSVTVANTTISGNIASRWGGAINAVGGSPITATLTNVTVAFNSSFQFGAIAVNEGQQFRIQNSIIAGNAEHNCGFISGGTVTDLGNNVEFPGVSCGFGLASDRRADPLLGPLAANGGSTETHAVPPDSPAIGLGDPAACAAAPVSGVDQRGFARPSAACDAGAFEAPDVTGPVMRLDKTSLNFGAVSDGARFTTQTPSQSVRLAQSGAGSVSWTAASSAPWLVVEPAAGSGSAILTISVQFAGGLAATQTGTITLSFPAAANPTRSLPVTLTVVTSSRSPDGAFETPTDNSTVSGAIAVTGWALDDIAVARVQIQRDAQAGDPPGAVVNGKVFIGDATFVEGARPDVQARYPSAPLNSRAGWGYLMLTRGLIWDGKGPFKLYALATDREGNTVTLGSKTITVNNASADKPFGAIDAPAPGATVSGTFPTTGWVLTPNAGATIPANGVKVSIDGVLLPDVPSMSDRQDVSDGFPGFNTTGAGRGLFIDSTRYTNGVHTLGWLVTDSLGKADGVGSRFITISNSSVVAGPALLAFSRQEVDGVLAVHGFLSARRGFDRDAPFESLPTADGRAVFNVEELDRIELRLDDERDSRYVGYARVGGRLEPLPIGSTLNGSTFTWQLAPGFLGRYDLVFVRERDGGPVERHEVRITVGARSAAGAPRR